MAFRAFFEDLLSQDVFPVRWIFGYKVSALLFCKFERDAETGL